MRCVTRVAGRRGEALAPDAQVADLLEGGQDFVHSDAAAATEVEHHAHDIRGRGLDRPLDGV